MKQKNVILFYNEQLYFSDYFYSYLLHNQKLDYSLQIDIRIFRENTNNKFGWEILLLFYQIFINGTTSVSTNNIYIDDTCVIKYFSEISIHWNDLRISAKDFSNIVIVITIWWSNFVYI